MNAEQQIVVKRRRGPPARRKKRFFLPLGGLADRTMVRLRYVESFNVAVAIASFQVHAYRANGMFDPTVAVGGHQPSGFDQMLQWYQHFTVVGAKATMLPAHSSTSNLVPLHYGIALTSTGSAVAVLGAVSVDSILESRLVGKYKTNSISGGASAFYQGVTKHFSAKKFFGTKNIVGKSLYRGDPTADPTEEAFFECFGTSVAGNDPGTQPFEIIIDYIAVLTEPRVLTPS